MRSQDKPRQAKIRPRNTRLEYKTRQDKATVICGIHSAGGRWKLLFGVTMTITACAQRDKRNESTCLNRRCPETKRDDVTNAT
jgi:hypothetical protein